MTETLRNLSKSIVVRENYIQRGASNLQTSISSGIRKMVSKSAKRKGFALLFLLWYDFFSFYPFFPFEKSESVVTMKHS